MHVRKTEGRKFSKFTVTETLVRFGLILFCV